MMVRTMLMISIEVIGKNRLIRLDSSRISPGNLPNQLKTPGATYNTAPMTIKNKPIVMITFAMVLSDHV